MNFFFTFICTFILLITGVGNISAQLTKFPFQQSSLAVEQRLEDVINRMTLDEKIALLSSYDGFNIPPCERLGIEAFSFSDGSCGVASWERYGKATAFPSNITIAATWNPKIADWAANMYAQEWRARGIHFLLGPSGSLYGTAKNICNFEHYGEDPYLTSELLVPFIKKLQENGVAAVIKYSTPGNDDRKCAPTGTMISKRAMQEVYLAPFRAAIERADVKGVMSGRNRINGVYSSENKELIDLLKNEFGFKGFYMSDWNATHSTLTAFKNGLDMEFGENRYYTPDRLRQAIAKDSVSMEMIDDKVRRIYRPCFEMGFFDRNQKEEEIPLYNQKCNYAALEIAKRGIVLLKNNGILPLDENKIKRIAVIGPTAYPTMECDMVCGGRGRARVEPWYIITDLDGIKNRFQNAEIYYHQGLPNRLKYGLFENSVFLNGKGDAGMKGRYYNGNVSDSDLKITRSDRHINFKGINLDSIGQGSEQMKIRWKGYILPDRRDRILFFVDAKGSYRLKLNGSVALEGNEPEKFRSDMAALLGYQGTPVNIELEYDKPEGESSEIRFGYVYNSDLLLNEMIEEAAKSDVVVYCGGFSAGIEAEGEEHLFNLPFGQNELIKRLIQVNKNTIVVMHGGGSVDMSKWNNDAAAIIHAMYPGMEGGNALASILSGDTNPSARLPFSIGKPNEDSLSLKIDKIIGDASPDYKQSIFNGYRKYDITNAEPLYAFGFGLSYTTFEYSRLRIRVLDESVPLLKASFTVTNSGKRMGVETPQLYIGDVKSSEVRPLKELKGFEKVMLRPGESKTIDFLLDDSSFRFFSEKKSEWTIEPGKFEIMIGASSQDIRLKRSITL